MLSSSSPLLPSVLSLVLLLSPLCQDNHVASATKDTDYYFPGFVNPNTDYKMYWKDSINVLQDLDQFESLYIRYHHCVWSKYGTRYGTGEDYEYGDEDEDANDNGCGGYGGEAFWYMGRTQCFKAQAAYSLYGVLKGDDPKMKRGSICHEDSYINSFFTTFGVESFAGPMGLGVDTANSYCVSDVDEEGNSGDNENDEYQEAKADDDYVGDDFTYVDYQDTMSIGVGCSAGGNFVMDQYNGAFCIGSNYNSTTDHLEDFNEAMRSFDCTEVYSASSNNNDDGDRRLEDQDYDFANMNAVQILSFSKSCSLGQYPNDCPDPYGKKRMYSKNILKALSYKTGNNRDLVANAMNFSAWIFLAAAVCLAGAAHFVRQSDGKSPSRRLKKKKSKKRFSKDGGIPASSSKDSKDTWMTDATDGGKSAASSTKRSPGRKMSRIFKLLRCEKAEAVDDGQDTNTEMELADYEAYNTAPRGLVQPPVINVEEGQLMAHDNASLSTPSVQHSDNGDVSPTPEAAGNGFINCGEMEYEVNEDVADLAPTTDMDVLDVESLTKESTVEPPAQDPPVEDEDPAVEALAEMEKPSESTAFDENAATVPNAEPTPINDEGVEMDGEAMAAAKGKRRSSFLNKLRSNTKAQDPTPKEGTGSKLFRKSSKKDGEESSALSEKARSVVRSLSFKKKEKNPLSPGSKKKMLSFSVKKKNSKSTEKLPASPAAEEEPPEPPVVQKVALMDAIKIILPEDDEDVTQGEAAADTAEDDKKYLL